MALRSLRPLLNLHQPAAHPNRVARLTRKEWVIRVVSLVIAFSFLATIFLSFFSGF